MMSLVAQIVLHPVPKRGRVINIFRDKTSLVRSKKLKKVIESIKEIELKIGKKPIDLEFAIDKSGNVNIFQIRPLTTIEIGKKYLH